MSEGSVEALCRQQNEKLQKMNGEGGKFWMDV